TAVFTYLTLLPRISVSRLGAADPSFATIPNVYVQSSAIVYSKFQKTKGKCIMRKPIKRVLLWLYCVIPLVNMHRKLSIYHAKRTLHIYRYLYSYKISHL